ncbi:uncharacterized protein LOC105189990 [Harpegnathos saltator]|uniref:uncharacterized protein LOC105189990 n=1 Tax=Harpegnathos saltator TaxID=610380 RepID=UPI00058EF38D|nr:uncharacterized protein LOC105189990 [Harpegnathos saltator]
MATRLLQANLHRARQAVALFEHTMAERGVGLGIAAEFNHVPKNHPRWRGEEVEEWAADLSLHILNEGDKPTFVGSQGESIIDLTWATPAARGRVQVWRVAEELESLSDHQIIEIKLSVTPNGLRPRVRRDSRPARWALSQLDKEKLDISFEAFTWPRWKEGQDLNSAVAETMSLIARACDQAMPKVRSCPMRSAWWWNDRIAELRRRSVRLRRIFRRAREDEKPPEVTLVARTEFCMAARALRKAIGAARREGWDNLLRSLDADPWGRPYKVVMKKLRPWTPPLTETLDPRFLERVMGTLFPVGNGTPPLDPYKPLEHQREIPG